MIRDKNGQLWDIEFLPYFVLTEHTLHPILLWDYPHQHPDIKSYPIIYHTLKNFQNLWEIYNIFPISSHLADYLPLNLKNNIIIVGSYTYGIDYLRTYIACQSFWPPRYALPIEHAEPWCTGIFTICQMNSSSHQL